MSEEIRVITKAQYEEYMELKKQAKTTQTKRWKPEEGKGYYAIWSHGRIDFYRWDNDIEDNNCFKLGNCFKSEEEAQKELDRRITERELLDLCDDSGFIEIGFDVDNREFCAMGEDSDYLFSPYRFATEESAQNAIKQLGEDKLKLIFRID